MWFIIRVVFCVGLVYSPLSSPGLCGERRTSRLIYRLTLANPIAASRLRRTIFCMC